MKEYRYVIVSSQGASLDLAGGLAQVPTGLFQKMWYHDERYQELQELLHKGWHPVRETGMGGVLAWHLRRVSRHAHGTRPTAPVPIRWR